MIISMAYTTPAFVAGRKTITRRSWTFAHARAVDAAGKFDAYSRDPRYKGEFIGEAKLTDKVKLRRISEDSAEKIYIEEGFAYLDDKDGTLRKLVDEWRKTDEAYWEVRFRKSILNNTDTHVYCTEENKALCRKALVRNLSGLPVSSLRRVDEF